MSLASGPLAVYCLLFAVYRLLERILSEFAKVRLVSDNADPSLVAAGSQPERLSDSSRWSQRSADHRIANGNDFAP